ncbi:DUF1127 domain-containing protein [Mesorhizobium sp. B2-3-15]|nr:DUF1127 domain-containing protein [Mesorhizobium sp. B2-3-15]
MHAASAILRARLSQHREWSGNHVRIQTVRYPSQFRPAIRFPRGISGFRLPRDGTLAPQPAAAVLHRLEDRQLEDIGISRNEIPHVVAGLVPSNIETSTQESRISAHAARLLGAARYQ